MINQKLRSNLLHALIITMAVIIAAVTIAILGFVTIMGAKSLRLSLFSINYNSTNASILPSFINTLILLLMASGIGGFFGITCAIFINEYAKKDSPFVKILVMAVTTLGGIPSIVYGIVGFLIFGVALKLGYCMISGVLTLSVMILPVVMRVTIESLKDVPQSLRDASLALGASNFFTLTHVTLPVARRAIFNGMILGASRITAESAALLYTAGTVPHIANSLFSSGRTMAVHLYCLYNEGLSTQSAYSSAFVLIIFCLLFNIASRLLTKERVL